MKTSIKYKKGFKYQLAEEYECTLSFKPSDIRLIEYIKFDTIGKLVIYKGYAWDGPSGPTIDTKTFMRGSLVHDALYQLIREGMLDPSYRILADKELKRICIEDGMCKLRASYVYWSVRKFAKYAASKENKRKIIFSP